MERKKHRRAAEAVKSLLIVLLTLSAAYLALRTQMYADFTGHQATGWLGAVLDFFDRGPGLLPPGGNESAHRLEVRPMRMAVNVQGVGRYAVQYDQERTDEIFTRVFSTLLEALDGAQAPRQIGEDQWREALSNLSGVYFDFQGTQPMSVLAALGGGSNPALPDVGVRRLLLAENGSGDAVLYYSNETDGMYYACETTQALQGHLQEIVMSYSVNGALFAYEGEYPGLDPYVLISQSTAAMPGSQSRPEIYTAANPVAEMSAGREDLLEALGFHSQSNNSYRRGDRLVVNEWPYTLNILDNGTIYYETTAADEPKYAVGTPGKPPTGLELVEATQALVERSVGAQAWRGEAGIYLMGVTETAEGVWQVDYGYSLNGITVQTGAEGYAARFIIEDGQISAFTLHMRSYADTGESSPVLPDVQAAAAMGALDAGGKELTLTYEDPGGTERLQARWIAQ